MQTGGMENTEEGGASEIRDVDSEDQTEFGTGLKERRER